MNDDIDLDRVWVNVAAQVWRRHPGRLERTAARLLRSPGLARALFTTPSLLLPWLIASAVVLAVGALTQVGAGQPLVWLIAPAVAAVGIAYSYGPGLDPAWELSCSMPVSDRLILLTRAAAVFAVNAVLGLIASAATLGTRASTGTLHLTTVQLTFAWLLPMTAACALALAVAVAVRSAIVGAGAGVGAWLTLVLAHGVANQSATAGAANSTGGGLSAAALTSAVTDANLYLPYLAVAACCAAIVLFAIRPQRGLL
jgi:ABC-type transport system involved in multi-copper enzyme maturation permease subunit